MACLFILKTALVAGITFTAAGAAFAQGVPQEGGPPRGGPPPEAISACTGKAVDTACSFTGRRGEKLEGKCFAPPPRREQQSGGNKPPMACRPEGMRPGGPPQQK